MRRLSPLALTVALIVPSLRATADEPSPPDRKEDVIYGRKYGTALTMDVFTPKVPNGLGLIFVVSGGWYSDHRAIDLGFVRPFTDRGYTVFAVVHSSQPKFTIPEILGDMHRAVRFIRHHVKEYGIDSDRLGIYGGSAGGHLSLMQGTAGEPGDSQAEDPVDRESSRVQAVACFFPPTDFLDYGKPGEVDLGTGILKDFPAPFDFHDLDPQRKKFVPVVDHTRIREIGRRISPMNHVSPDDPPTLILHGDADTLVPIQQAEVIVAKLKEAGVEAKLVVKPRAGHGWPDIGQDLEQFADWFDGRLKKKPGEEGRVGVIPTPQAADHLGERCTVEMTVRSSKNATRHGEYYLDSEEDFHNERNLAIVIAHEHAGRFRESGIADPAAYYRGKAIRVTGRIIRQADQVRIRVSDPEQIVVVEGARRAPWPSPWLHRDFGEAAVPGFAVFEDGTFALTGTQDIWGEADGGHFVYRPLEGDGQIVARVLAVENTNEHAKAGVMIRETLGPGARHATMVVTPVDGTQFLRRKEAGGRTTNTNPGLDRGKLPRWVKLLRAGSTFSAFESADGQDWILAGSDTVPMGAKVYIGLVASSHQKKVTNTSKLDHVAVEP